MIQTHDTCWLYSILNGLLLSTTSQKILKRKVVNYIQGLSPDERISFHNPEEFSCPRKGRFLPRFRLWKYIYQTLYSRGTGATKSGLSPVFLKNLRLNKVYTVNSGGYPEKEIAHVLHELKLFPMGAIKTYYYNKSNMSDLQNVQVIIRKNPSNTTDIPLTMGDFVLTCGVCLIKLEKSNHALIAIIKNGKGYIMDPNYFVLHRCNWWNPVEQEYVIRQKATQYGKIYKVLKMDYVLYFRGTPTQGTLTPTKGINVPIIKNTLYPVHSYYRKIHKQLTVPGSLFGPRLTGWAAIRAYKKRKGEKLPPAKNWQDPSVKRTQNNNAFVNRLKRGEYLSNNNKNLMSTMQTLLKFSSVLSKKNALQNLRNFTNNNEKVNRAVRIMSHPNMNF